MPSHEDRGVNPHFVLSSKPSVMGSCLTHVGHLYHGATDWSFADPSQNAMMANPIVTDETEDAI
jgi:hypothetical protein